MLPVIIGLICLNKQPNPHIHLAHHPSLLPLLLFFEGVPVDPSALAHTQLAAAKSPANWRHHMFWFCFALNFHSYSWKSSDPPISSSSTDPKSSPLFICVADLVASPNLFSNERCAASEGIAQLRWVRFMSEEPCCWWVSHCAFASALPLSFIFFSTQTQWKQPCFCLS